MKHAIFWAFVMLLLAWALLVYSGTAIGATVDLPAGTAASPRTITQADVDRAGAGGTLRLGAGWYAANRLRPKAGMSITGTTQIVAGAPPRAMSESVIRPTGREAFYVENVNKVTLRNVSIDGPGGALWVEGGDVQDVTIDQCRLNSSGPAGGNNNLLYMTYTRRLNITDCIITGGGGVNQLFFSYGVIEGTIAFNWFSGGGDCIHIDAKNDCNGFVIEQNRFGEQKRMAVEYQGKGFQNVIQDNWTETPNWGAPDNLLNFSLPADQSWGTIARRNVSIVPDGPGPQDYVRMLFEFASRDFQCVENVTIGGNHVVAVTNSQATGKVIGNHFERFRKGPDNNGGKVEVRDNVNPALRDKLLARGRPGPMIRYGSAPPEPPVEPPPPTRQRVIVEGLDLTVTGP